ncbi:hypothetical protein GOBAR_DD26381 [Gossypium barbadense]|nr:hypothetical protein GOBAR_DD26381 [Gossypium barbadense]
MRLSPGRPLHLEPNAPMSQNGYNYMRTFLIWACPGTPLWLDDGLTSALLGIFELPTPCPRGHALYMPRPSSRSHAMLLSTCLTCEPLISILHWNPLISGANACSQTMPSYTAAQYDVDASSQTWLLIRRIAHQATYSQIWTFMENHIIHVAMAPTAVLFASIIDYRS